MPVGSNSVIRLDFPPITGKLSPSVITKGHVKVPSLTSLLGLHVDGRGQGTVSDTVVGHHSDRVSAIGQQVADRGQLGVVHLMDSPQRDRQVLLEGVEHFVALEG